MFSRQKRMRKESRQFNLGNANKGKKSNAQEVKQNSREQDDRQKVRQIEQSSFGDQTASASGAAPKESEQFRRQSIIFQWTVLVSSKLTELCQRYCKEQQKTQKEECKTSLEIEKVNLLFLLLMLPLFTTVAENNSTIKRKRRQLKLILKESEEKSCQCLFADKNKHKRSHMWQTAADGKHQMKSEIGN